MTDVEGALLTYLLGRPSLLATLASYRGGSAVWAGTDFPMPDYAPGQGGAICFKSRGGEVDSSDALLVASVQFKCYGLTEESAGQVYRALFDNMHDSTGNGTVRLIRHEAGLGQILHEPDTEWPFVLGFFTVWVVAQS